MGQQVCAVKVVHHMVKPETVNAIIKPAIAVWSIQY